jgi:perosamine synthetase
VPPVAFEHGAGRVARAAVTHVPLGVGCSQVWGIEDVHVFGFGSGKSAMRCVLEAMAALCPGRRRVVVPAYTCYSIPAAVEYAGLELVLCDIDPQSLDFDPDMLHASVDERTLCVVPVHLFGAPVALLEWAAAAHAVGAFVLEDSAQGGESRDGLDSGADGRIYSTARGKPVSTFGGGVAACRSPRLAAMLSTRYEAVPPARRMDRWRGSLGALASDALSRPWLYWIPAAMPFLKLGRTCYPDRIDVRRLSGLHAALLSMMADRMPAVMAEREESSRFYMRRLSDATRERQPACVFGAAYAPMRYPYLLAKPLKDVSRMVLATGRRQGVVPMYPQSLAALERIDSFCVNRVDRFPGAGEVAAHLVTLPTHRWVGKDGRGDVCEAVLAMEA